MTLPSSPPITLQQIQNEFGVSSLSGAGLAYFGRANCNMLEFLGASANVYNFQNYQANTSGSTNDVASAFINYYADGTVVVHYDIADSNGYPTTHYWLTRGNPSGVEGYVTRITTPTPGFNYGGEPTLNSWIPIDSIRFGVSSFPPANEYGAWNISFRDSRGNSIGSVSHQVILYVDLPERFGTSYYFSDVRLKENIQKIGQIDGLNVYTYNYLNSKISYTGVMAQELFGTKYESAVITHPSGFYQVDYSKIPVTRRSF
jgi:hypothetical protein